MTTSILRNLIMRYGAQIGINSVEKAILWHIIDYDHKEKGFSFPSEPTLANLINASDRYVRKIIESLSQKKLIRIKRKIGFVNHYYYSGIKKSMQPFLKKELKQRKTTPDYSSAPPGLQFRTPRTIVPTNTANNTANNTAYTYGNAKRNTPLKKSQVRSSIKNQLEFNFEKPKQVVEHLREITTHEGNGKAAADLTLRILEQLWTWGFRDELLKSWKWFFYAAAMWPAIVEQSWSEIKNRKLQGEKMNKPGAILTLKIKELTNGNTLP